MGQTYIIQKIDEGGRTEIGRLEGDEVPVGREGSAGLAIPSASISREHGVFLSHHGRWFYKDLGSTNGSWLNGKKLSRGDLKLVKPNDILQLADVGLKIEAPGEAEAETKSLIVFSHGQFLQEFPVPEFGRALVVGGSKADLKLNVDIYDLPSLVIEKRGSAICAYSIAREVPVGLNDGELKHTVMLTDRDELRIEHYLVILNDAHETALGSDVGVAVPPEDQVAAPPDEASPRVEPASRPIRTLNPLFGKPVDDDDEAAGVDQTMALDPSEINARLAGHDRPPSMRMLEKEAVEPSYSFEALENKILMAIAVVLFLVLAVLAIWWLIPQGAA